MAVGVLTREELYVMPVILFLIYFYKYEINIKNFLSCSLKIFPFFIFVLLHMYLRKEFIPEADHLQITGFTIKFGENFLNFGGLIKAFKSSFLPMGYLSSQYSSLEQSIFSWVWIVVMLLSTIILLKKKNIIFNLKKIFILILLVLICCLPHLTVARSFGIYLSSFFALALIAKLIDVTKNSVTSIRNKSYWNYNNLNPKDPVALNLFSQKDLIDALEKAERRVKREKKEKEKQIKANQASL